MLADRNSGIAFPNKVVQCRRMDKSINEYFNLNQNLGSFHDASEHIRVIEACLMYNAGDSVSPKYTFIHRTTRCEALYTAAYIVFRLQVRHRIVTRLLRAIFKQEGCFEVLFFRVAVFKRFAEIRQRSMPGWPVSRLDGSCSRAVTSQESLLVMEFYLEHAARERLVFAGRPTAESWYQESGARRRFVDLALEQQVDAQLPAVATAIHLANVEVLHLLLRHGARLDFSEEGGNFFLASSFIVRCLFREYLRDRQGFLIAIPTSHLQCLQLLLRAVPQVDPLAWLKKSKLSDADTRLFVDHLRTRVLPASRCGVEPPELKHLCRCVIRHVLRDTWQLPGGIYQMGLPGSVARYIDLETD